MYTSPRHSLIDHSLNFNSTFSERKLKFAIAKAMIQFKARRYLGNSVYHPLGKLFEAVTDQLLNTDEGTHSIAIKLRNVGNEDLEYVKVDLNSLDAHGLLVYGTYKTIADIEPNETEEMSFEVEAFRTTDVYIILMPPRPRLIPLGIATDISRSWKRDGRT